MSTCVSPDQCPARVRIIYTEMGGTPISFLLGFYWIAPITSSPTPPDLIPDQWVRGPEMHIPGPQVRVRKHASKKV